MIGLRSTVRHQGSLAYSYIPNATEPDFSTHTFNLRHLPLGEPHVIVDRGAGVEAGEATLHTHEAVVHAARPALDPGIVRLSEKSQDSYSAVPDVS